MMYIIPDKINFINKLKISLLSLAVGIIGFSATAHAQSNDFNSDIIIFSNQDNAKFSKRIGSTISDVRVRELTERGKRRGTSNFHITRHTPTRPAVSVKPNKPGNLTRPPVNAKPSGPTNAWWQHNNDTKPPVGTRPPVGGRIEPVDPGNTLMGTQSFRKQAPTSSKKGLCSTFSNNRDCR